MRATKKHAIEVLREQGAKVCREAGVKLSARPNKAEIEQIVKGTFPARVVSAKSFAAQKVVEHMPSAGHACMCCGKAIAAGDGAVIVSLNTSGGQVFKTVCPVCFAEVIGIAKPAATPATTPVPATPTPPAAAATPPATLASSELGEALDALKSAIPAKPKPVTEQVKAEAVAVAAAVQSAKDGGKPAAPVKADGGKQKPKAVKDGVAVAEKAASWKATATPAAMDAVDKLSKFLSEFSYFRDGVSMRLVNTFARAKTPKAKAEVLESYATVSAMEDKPELVEKMKSQEFNAVCDAFSSLGVSPKSINKRFAVFYGSPGGGKTYSAVEACKEMNGDGECETVPCSSGMDAADMLYSYRIEFDTGKKGYVPTGLLNAMLAGRGVVLDEINLLPMDARMFLQNILDNKSKVSVMGTEIPIRDGFFVFGTMNVETGAGTQPLPLPLVDRAAVVKEFKATLAQSAVGAGLC